MLVMLDGCVVAHGFERGRASTGVSSGYYDAGDYFGR